MTDKSRQFEEEIQDLKEELENFVNVLDKLPEREPPQYLQKTIESQIRLAVQDDTLGEKQGLFGTWMPANWLRTGLAVAAGAVLTVGIYQMGSEPMSARDAEQMTGTVVKSPILEPLNLQDSVSFNTEKLSGQLELRSTGNLFTLNLQLSSAGPSEVIVNISDYGLEFEKITPVRVFFCSTYNTIPHKIELLFFRFEGRISFFPKIDSLAKQLKLFYSGSVFTNSSYYRLKSLTNGLAVFCLFLRSQKIKPAHFPKVCGGCLFSFVSFLFWETYLIILTGIRI